MSSIRDAKHSTLGQAFLHCFRKFPNKVSLYHKEGEKWVGVSFKEQCTYVRTLSTGLRGIGAQEGEKLAILGDTSIMWSRMEIAAQGCGLCVVPVYPSSPNADVEYILNHADVSYIFTDSAKGLAKIKEVWGNCKKLKACIVQLDLKKDATQVNGSKDIYTLDEVFHLGLNDAENKALLFEKGLESQKPEDIYTICYTSGTTGRPKGVMLAHSCMMSALEDTKLKLEEGDIMDEESLLSFLPMSHIFGRYESYVPYVIGWKQSFAESIDRFVDNLSEVSPSVIFAVPRIFEKVYGKIMEGVSQQSSSKKMIFNFSIQCGNKFLDSKYGINKSPALLSYFAHKLSSAVLFKRIRKLFGGNIRLCLSGGAPLSSDIARFMEIVGVPVFQGYGLTETCAPIACNIPGKNKYGAVGTLLDDVLLKIAEDGEILIKSEKNFKGYYKNEEATREVLQDGWFKTGDIGHLDEDAYLVITDRKKDLIKTAGGKFVVPQKIEALANQSLYISQIVLYGDGKPYVTALVTLSKDILIQHAKESKILFSDFSELIKQKEIKKLVDKEIQKINSCLGSWETLKHYHILPEEFTIEKGELTPSMKVKRKFLTTKYRDILDGLYS